jgi:hypothetical protein
MIRIMHQWFGIVSFFLRQVMTQCAALADGLKQNRKAMIYHIGAAAFVRCSCRLAQPGCR